MEPSIKTISEKKLIGKRLPMSLTANRTFELWKSFMPFRKDIKNTTGTDLFSMRVYETSYDFKNFDPGATFDKWAAVEVNDFNAIPAEMEKFILEGGMYVVFLYKGLNTDTSIFNYIFSDWLPDSLYDLDHRPHFELLGEKYKNNDPDSEEEIWVPVKLKKTSS